MNKKVMSKIAKLSNNVELKSEVIELKNLKEIKTQVKYLNSLETELEKSVEKYMSIFTELENAWRKSNNIRNQANGGVSDSLAIIKDFEKAAKELGVNVSDIKEVNELQSTIKKTLENQKLWDGFAKPKL